MFKKITIQNFRGIKNLTIEDFGKVNLFVGKNNSCKTTVLEALKIAHSGNIFDEIYKLNKNRRLDSDKENTFTAINKSLSSIFYNLDITNKVFLQSIFNDSEENILFYADKETIMPNNSQQAYRWLSEINLPSKEYKEIGEIPFKAIIPATGQFSEIKKLQETLLKFGLGLDQTERTIDINENLLVLEFSYPFNKEPIISEGKEMKGKIRNNNLLLSSQSSEDLSFQSNAESFAKIIKQRKENNLVKLLKEIDESIQNILFDGNTFLIDFGEGKERLNINLIGEGIKKIFKSILEITASNLSNGVLLIDEIENGLHYTAQEKLWSWLFEIAEEKNIQIFATTHSIDAVRAFTQTAKDKEEKDIRLFRLEKYDDEIIETKYNYENLETAVEEMNLDPR